MARLIFDLQVRLFYRARNSRENDTQHDYVARKTTRVIREKRKRHAPFC